MTKSGNEQTRATTDHVSTAAGGITTVLDMPNVQPPPNTVERFRAHLANAAAGIVVAKFGPATVSAAELIAAAGPW